MPLKILHVTNIAENAYTNAKILKRAGHDCDVLAYDLYHFASSPEWYDLFEADAPHRVTEDGFFPDFYSLNRDMPVIGPHVAQGPMYNALVYLDLRRRGEPLAQTALSALRYLRFKCTMLRTTTPFGFDWPTNVFHEALSQYDLPAELHDSILAGRIVDDILEAIRARLMRFSSKMSVFTVSVPFDMAPTGALASAIKFDTYLREMIQWLRENRLLYALGLELTQSEASDLGHLKHVGPVEDLIQFQMYGDLWRKLDRAYDIIIFYSDSSMFAVTNGVSNYCALEHGTIRSIPFEDSTYGRLVAAGFMNAYKVFITNADYVTSKPRLPFARKQFVYLPHPFEDELAFGFSRQFRKPVRKRGVVRFLCPARQDWRSRDPRMSKGNDYIFHASKILIDQGIKNFHLTCIAWGVDLQATKDLCAELGLEKYVSWIAPQTKRRIWEETLAHDCVIDQFLISAMGGVSFETLALGRRLISRDDGVENREFFDVPPPILSAATVDEIVLRMNQVIADPDDQAGIGTRCIEWVAEHHSAQRNTTLQMAVFDELLAKKRKMERKINSRATL